MKSVVEMIHDVLLAEFGSIRKNAGYRNDVVEVLRLAPPFDKVGRCPVIALEVGTQLNYPDDSASESFQSEVTFHLYGFVKGKNANELNEQAESLVHDCSRVINSLYTKHVIGNSAKWMVSRDNKYVSFSRILFTDSMDGWIYGEFIIQVLAQSEDYNA